MLQECRMSLRQRLCPSQRPRPQASRRPCRALASSPRAAPGGGGDAWWDSLNRLEGIKGPGYQPPQESSAPRSVEEAQKGALGKQGYNVFQDIKKNERQRVWDDMRQSAAIRYEMNEMPSWFDPEWLNIQEAPMNTYWREQGMENYQAHDRELALIGGGGTGDNNGIRGGSGGGSGPDGWWGWNEEDPYWSLRDWGDHPMRWWTLGFAIVLAVGGLAAYLHSGSCEALQVGWAAAACLTGCSMAMSDMTYDWQGHLAVKVAWGVCASLAVKELLGGWQHKRTAQPHRPHLEACGWVGVMMCTMYMWTGMAELGDALPTNPGGAFKTPDVAMKHRVWERWGYGDVQMRI